MRYRLTGGGRRGYPTLDLKKRAGNVAVAHGSA
jgi:hypothetical protein